MFEHERIVEMECGCRYDTGTGIRTAPCEDHRDWPPVTTARRRG